MLNGMRKLVSRRRPHPAIPNDSLPESGARNIVIRGQPIQTNTE